MKALTLKDTALFWSRLPDANLQKELAVTAARTLLFDLLSKSGWPLRPIMILCEHACAQHISELCCFAFQASSVRMSLRAGFPAEQFTLNEFCCHLTIMQPRHEPKNHSKTPHQSDAHLAADHDRETVGGLDEDDLEQDSLGDDGCQFVCRHPWPNPSNVVDLALERHELKNVTRLGASVW